MSEIYRLVYRKMVFFDSEFVPCIDTARRVYGLPKDMETEDVRGVIAAENPATPQNPRAFLKPLMYRVVSVSSVIREEEEDGTVTLKLWTLPNGNLDMPEGEILETFLERGIGRKKPQLVGYASGHFDLTVMFQRAMVQGCRLMEFCTRPAKPWEGVDYFAKFGDWHVDLMQVVSGTGGKGAPSLSEMCRAVRIPGKLSADGSQVADMWFEGKHREIVNYNETDACSTYLLWLETARLAGFLDHEAYLSEQKQFRGLLDARIEQGAEHLAEFTREWDRLNGIEVEEEQPAASEGQTEDQMEEAPVKTRGRKRVAEAV